MPDCDSSSSGGLDHVSTIAIGASGAVSAIYRGRVKRSRGGVAFEAVTLDRRTLGAISADQGSRLARAAGTAQRRRQARTLSVFLEELIAQDPDVTLYELRDALADAEGVTAAKRP